MPTFHTPQPITARVEAAAGSIRLIAGDRTDTVVEVRPHDASCSADVRSAEHARVDYANGRLAVAPAKLGFLGYRTGAVDIVVELPARSRIEVAVASADVQADGEFAHVGFKTASGRLDVQAITGSAQISSASGDAMVGSLDGALKFQAASGSLSIERLRGDVRSHTASGSASIAVATEGTTVAHTSSGHVEVGIPEGTAARLDIMTGSGAVTNACEPADGPATGENIMVVTVRSASGDIDIHRSITAAAP